MVKSKPYHDWIEKLAIDPSKLSVESDAGAELCDLMVCRLGTNPLIEPDNLVGQCSKCFRMIQFRPHAPKRPEKICDECAVKIVAKDDDPQFMVTRKTLTEIMQYAIRKRAN